VAIKNMKTEHSKLFCVLLDSGTNKCIGTKAAVKQAGLQIKASHEHHCFKATVDAFTTTHNARIKSHCLLELNISVCGSHVMVNSN